MIETKRLLLREFMEADYDDLYDDYSFRNNNNLRQQ